MRILRNRIILLAVFILAVFLRFYQLDNTKHGFYLDEAAIGYNAYSILKTGKDEFGKSFPLLFRSFTDFKAPLYIYLSIIPIKIFGLSIFSTRFISALSGSLSVIFVYLILKLITKKKDYLPLLGALIFAISPWHVFYSRGAWESNLSFLILLIGTYFCVTGYSTKRKVIFLLGAILFVLSTYAYHAQRIVAPLILGSYLLYYRKWILIKNKFLIFGFISLTLVALPILAISLTSGGQSRAKSLSYFPEEALLPWQNNNLIQTNRGLVVVRKWLALYTAYYTPRSLFSPDAVEKQRWLVDLATFYPWQFFFFILGLIGFVQKKEYENARPILLPWLLFSPVAASFTGDPFSTVRALPLVFPMSFLIAVGIFESIKYFKNKITRNVFPSYLPTLFISLISILVIISVVNLLIQLFYILPYQRPKYWEIGYAELGKNLLQYPNQKIVIDNSRGESYIHVLFFTKFDPKIYQKEAGYLELPDYYNSYKRAISKKFGQFEYRPIDWGKEEKEGNIVIGDELISSRENILSNPRLQLLEEILYPDQTVAFRIIKVKSTNSH